MTRRALLGTLLATFVVLVAIGMAGMLDPPVESRAAVDVPYDVTGPLAQPFKVGSIEGWLARQSDGTFRAYSAADPRLRCRIEFIAPGHPFYRPPSGLPGSERGYFVDRCMHSHYAFDGARFYGPTPRSLDEFVVNDVRDGRVYLDLTRMKRGVCGEGVRATGHCSLLDRPRFSGPSTVDEAYTSKFPWPLY